MLSIYLSIYLFIQAKQGAYSKALDHLRLVSPPAALAFQSVMKKHSIGTLEKAALSMGIFSILRKLASKAEVSIIIRQQLHQLLFPSYPTLSLTHHHYPSYCSRPCCRWKIKRSLRMCEQPFISFLLSLLLKLMF